MKQRFTKLVMLLLALSCLLLSSCGSDKPKDSTESTNEENASWGELETQSIDPSETEVAVIMPWEEEGAKAPKDYTMEEYESLTAEQQKAFQKYLGTAGFTAWLEQTEAGVNPWDLPDAKQPEDYSWDEYEAMTEAQKKAFMEHLGPYGLEAWLNKVQNQTAEYPWGEYGAKQPKDYNLSEYESLTEEQQQVFEDHLGTVGFQEWLESIQGQKITYPWEESGAKQPGDYTWEEYTGLTESLKVAFQEYLGADSFGAWIKKVFQQDDAPNWDASGTKKPQDYTWEEFSALSTEQQMAFQNHLGAEAFEAWLSQAQGQPSVNPWDVSGAKQPTEYTWGEFEALPADQQISFQNYMGQEVFDVWLNRVQAQTAEHPWNDPGAKQPADYTWEEFEVLTAAQQMAFQNHLGAEAFEAWLSQAQGQPSVNPWDVSGAKQPTEYTWGEFEALPADQQISFQNYMGQEAFEVWFNGVLGQTAENPWDDLGAKQPTDYTWEEFEALTGAQQIAFQTCLGSEAFGAWLNRVQNQTIENPWELSGAKQPEDYTWEEFEALTGAQQMAFQNYLGPEAFEAWLNRVQ